MMIAENRLRAPSRHGSGQVRRFTLPESKTAVTQITTFCPDGVGPGPTNLYLIEGDRLILVDAGLPTRLVVPLFYDCFNRPLPDRFRDLDRDLSLTELSGGLGLAGRGLEEIELLVLTHGHWDHFLMARTIIERSRAKVAVHLLDTPNVCNPWSMLLFWESRWREARLMGMPLPTPLNQEVVRRLDPLELGLGLEIDYPLTQEGPLPAGSDDPLVEVIHLPGHSPGSIGLIVGREEEERLLISGDVILSPISPIPHDLPQYLSTLRRLKNLKAAGLVLPAHGRAVRNLEERAGFLLDHHRRRLKRTLEAGAEPVSAWEVATGNGYFDVAVNPEKFNFLAGHEALAHLKLLGSVNANQVVEVRQGCLYFRSSGEDFEAVWERISDLIGG